MTKAELLQRISSKELSEWMALGLLRADEREQRERDDKLARGR